MFDLRRRAGKKSLLSSALSHVEEGSEVNTDTWSGYQLLDEVYDHRQVKHSERYVSEEGAHCNTAESEWSVFKPRLRTFRGMAKRNLYLYLSEHSFRRSHRHLSRQERMEVVLGLMRFLRLGQVADMKAPESTPGSGLGQCASFLIRAKELKRLLEASPPEEEENASRWTAPTLARHLEEALDIEVHPETVHRALRRLGFSWTRPRRRLPPTDGEKYQQRMAEVVEAIGEVGTETTVLFEDETERFPPLRRMWQPVGQQRAVDVPSNNEDFAFYGVVDVLEGGVYIERHPKKISEHTISFLESVLAQATGEVLLIWDQAPDYWTVCSLGSFIDRPT